MRLLLPILLVISCATAFANEEAANADKVLGTTSIENTEASAIAEQAAPALPAKDTRQESEIPLNLDGPKKASSESSGVFRVLFTAFILGMVGIGAFIFIRKYKIPKASVHQTQIKVLQQHYLGPKKSLAIIRVAGESILIGITDHNISMIKNLSLLDDEVPEESPRNFGSVLNKMEMEESEDSKSKTRAARDNRSEDTQLDADEEFAISGIKDIVSKRLKGMRSL